MERHNFRVKGCLVELNRLNLQFLLNSQTILASHRSIFGFLPGSITYHLTAVTTKALIHSVHVRWPKNIQLDPFMSIKLKLLIVILIYAVLTFKKIILESGLFSVHEEIFLSSLNQEAGSANSDTVLLQWTEEHECLSTWNMMFIYVWFSIAHSVILLILTDCIWYVI